MTTQEREAYDAMLACLCGLKMMAAYEAKLGQSKWRDILPSLDATIAQAQKGIEMKPSTRRHDSGLLQYLVDGEYKFQVCGFGPRSTGQAGWVTMAAQSSDGHYCKVYADITPKDTVIFNGYRIPKSRWIH